MLHNLLMTVNFRVVFKRAVKRHRAGAIVVTVDLATAGDLLWSRVASIAVLFRLFKIDGWFVRRLITE
jgi:hypothetical protein